MLTVYAPSLPCGRVPGQCSEDGKTPHGAHDWNLPEAAHSGWHCYGYSVTPSGRRVGWGGGSEEPPEDAVLDACQNAEQRRQESNLRHQMLGDVYGGDSSHDHRWTWTEDDGNGHMGWVCACTAFRP